MFRKFLVPVDGSEVSAKAARAAVGLARQTGARLVVYHAIDPIPYGFRNGGAPQEEPSLVELEVRLREAAERHVDAVTRAAARAGVRCETVVEVARPDEGIVAAARQRKCDGIFIASHGLRGLKRLLLGSVVSRVLANAEVPVIVYR